MLMKQFSSLDVNKSCRVFVKLSRLVNFIFFDQYIFSYEFVNFDILLWSTEIFSEVQWLITPSWRTLMQNPTNTKVIYNGVLHNLAHFRIFWEKIPYLTTKKFVVSNLAPKVEIFLI
jgi:hypothetical protein